MAADYTDILVSVIIPIYNMQDYLTRCIRSVLAQTHRKTEIILVVAESSDNSFNLCFALAAEDGRIKLVRQTGTGLGAARNQGIRVSSGEYLCFIDSDDWVEPQFVEILLRAAKDNQCLMATVARYDAYDERKLEQPAEEIKLMNYRDYLIYMRCSKQPSYSLWATWLSIYHRRIIKNFQFSLHKRGEECNCWHKLPLAAQTIAVSNQVLYHWFQRSDSMSRPMKRGAEFFEFIPPAKEAVDFWKEHNEPELANMYWEVYFSALIQITTECARDIPEYMSEINEFMHEIEANKHTAIQRGHSALLLPIHSKSWWNALRSTDSPMVMYGYGRNGKNLLPWLRYFQIPIAEIWDQSAPREGSDINGVPFRRMHGRFAGGETQILCSIEDRKVYLPVQRELRLLGYERFIPYDVLQYAVRYKIFERFTPFLLWDYTDQTYAIWGEEQ